MKTIEELFANEDLEEIFTCVTDEKGPNESFIQFFECDSKYYIVIDSSVEGEFEIAIDAMKFLAEKYLQEKNCRDELFEKVSDAIFGY